MQTAGFHALTLVSKTREYDQVYTFAFQPETPVAFEPGQYVHLLAPQSPPGRENVRHLSVASTPAEGPLRFTFDLSSSSAYKTRFADLEVGGKAHLFKVKGAFVLGDPPPARAVFLAGGLGITPVRALLRQITAEKLPVEWRLAHVARSAFLYGDEIAGWGGDQHRLRRDQAPGLVRRWAAEWPLARWYVSGSHRFVEGMTGELTAAGVPEGQLVREDFS